MFNADILAEGVNAGLGINELFGVLPVLPTLPLNLSRTSLICNGVVFVALSTESVFLSIKCLFSLYSSFASSTALLVSGLTFDDTASSAFRSEKER